MRRACRKLWRSMPCKSRKSLRTDSRKDMEEILRAKLSTIMEEPEYSCEENITPPPPRHLRMNKKQGKKEMQGGKKDKTTGRCLVPHVNLKQSYVLFITGFGSKGSFSGFLQR